MEKRTKLEKEILRSKIKESLKLNPKKFDSSNDTNNDTANDAKEPKLNCSNSESKPQDLDNKAKKPKSIANDNPVNTITTEQCEVSNGSRILPKASKDKSLMNKKSIPTSASILISNSPKASGNKSDSKAKNIPNIIPCASEKK